MKYIVILGDGMADRPVKELAGKTPLQAASVPNMDRLAREGIIGKVRTVPQGFHPDRTSPISLSWGMIREFYTGAPLEAASIGPLKERRCVPLQSCHPQYNKDKTKAVMDDYSSGHIKTEEASELIERSTGRSARIPSPSIGERRHIMVWSSRLEDRMPPPHDITGRR
jgi:2,3-bisphosphoglycerate-independent phosphoglycerate mutase